MTMIDLITDHYEELSQLERDVITTTDCYTAEITWFEDVEDFKTYCKEYNYLGLMKWGNQDDK